MLELIGYLASFLVALSMLMTSLLRLRLVNLVGSAVFGIYGLLIHAYPVAAVNFFIAGINIYHVVRMRRTNEYFTLVRVTPESDYLLFFIEKNLEDIRKFNPGFSYAPVPNQVTVFVVRDLQPAGLFIGQIRDNAFCVMLDYVIPGYRDLKVGKYLMEDRADFFESLGVQRIITPAGSELHADYLERLGFKRAEEGSYQRDVSVEARPI